MKIKEYFSLMSLLFLIVILSGCSPFQTAVDTALVSTDLVTPSVTPSSRTTDETPSSANEIVVGTPVVYVDEARIMVEQRCPDSREVMVAELGLSPVDRLILSSYDEIQGEPIKHGLYFVSSNNQEPEPIVNTNSTEVINFSYFSINPTGQWILFAKWGEEKSKLSWWISSLDGRNQREVVTADRKQWVYWPVEDEIIVLGLPEGRSVIYPGMHDNPIFSINPFTGKKTELNPLPDNAFFDGYSSVLGKSYSEYYVGLQPFEEYALFDYSTGSSISIAPWLIGVDWINYHTGGVGITNDGFFDIVVNRPYGFDFVTGLDLETIRLDIEYEEIMRSFDLSNYADDWSVWSLGINTFGIHVIDDNDNSVDLYTYNYSTNTLTDYCLDVEETYHRIILSKSGRFAAITILEGSSGENPLYSKEVIILDLNSGFIARIEKMKAVGWGNFENE